MCKFFVAVLILIVFCGTAYAGGSGEHVEIVSFNRSSDTEFILEVRVVHSKDSLSRDSYMGRCPKFQVNGSYSRLYSWWNFGESVSLKMHREALSLLESAKASNKPILFGWMGQGFNIPDPINPCFVESRALKVVETYNGERMITSFYNPT